MAAPESAAALVLALLRPPGVRRVEKTGAARPPGLVDYDTLRRCVNAVRSALIVRASLACGNGDRREAGGAFLVFPNRPAVAEHRERHAELLPDVVRGATLAASASADSSPATPGSSVDTFTWIFCCLFCAACQRIAVPHGIANFEEKGQPSVGNGKKGGAGSEQAHRYAQESAAPASPAVRLSGTRRWSPSATTANDHRCPCEFDQGDRELRRCCSGNGPEGTQHAQHQTHRHLPQSTPKCSHAPRKQHPTRLRSALPCSDFWRPSVTA